MAGKTRLCSLDYLLGTLATAYKGLVTSLVMKDFCIEEEAGMSTFGGTLLSMPEGAYEITLMQSGVERARSGLREGYFELVVPTPVVAGARNLQLDVVQKGRHVGTFVMKRDAREGPYVSAFELSEELRWVDFKMLDDMLKGRTGLQRAGERVITSLLSTKKDWRKLSDTINTLGRDLFWYERRAFAMWFEVLARYALNAARNEGRSAGDKTVANALSLLELPLNEEDDEEKLATLVRTWIREFEAVPVDLSLRLRQAMVVVRLIHERLPGLDPSSLLYGMLDAIRTARPPVIRDQVVQALGEHMRDGDIALLARHSERHRAEVLRDVERAGNMVKEEGDVPRTLETLEGMEARIFDEGALVADLLAILERNVGLVPPEALETALGEALRLARTVSEEAHRGLMNGLSRVLRHAMSSKTAKTGEVMLGLLEGAWDEEDDLKDIILTGDMARAIVGSGEGTLIEKYKDMLMEIHIPPPQVSGFSNDTWAELAHPLHLDRVRGFMEVIAAGGEGMRDVFLHAIACLHISGVFIPDDRLFQRQVSAYLNSGAAGRHFLLSFMLLKQLPVYFNEVGASGKVRDYSTDIDSWGNDPAIYFLRKQIHVNASNRNIPLVEGMLRAWAHGDPALLTDLLPPDIHEKVEPAVLAGYSRVIRPFFESSGVMGEGRLRLERLRDISDEELASSVPGDDESSAKVRLLILIYLEVMKKYGLHPEEGPEARDAGIRLAHQVEELVRLTETVRSPEKTEAVENLYFKRHIAFGIPSVIGTYQEAKFDALGARLRIEEAARALLEDVIAGIDERGGDFEADELRGWFQVLSGVNRLFSANGLRNMTADEVVALLTGQAGGIHLSQVTDLLRIWQRELTWHVESFYRAFHSPVVKALMMYRPEELPGRLGRLRPEEKGFHDRAADILVKDIINSVTGMEELDRLLNVLIKTVTYRLETKGDMLLEGDAQAGDFAGCHTLDELAPEETVRLGPALGGKAKNLVHLINADIPVPAGVTFSASHTSDFERYVESGEFREALVEGVRAIETRSGLLLGGERNPLFLSVRSGSYISMPGLLESILYVGMNNTTVEALARSTGDPRLARDSMRRFMEQYATVVFGLERKPFEDIMRETLARRALHDPQELGLEDMGEVVRDYRAHLAERGCLIPDDPMLQLVEGVRAVYRSWYEKKAADFRKAVGVSEHWGTAVTLMQMVYGNARDAGASVFFTRNPGSLRKSVYGETRSTATGEDLVGGRWPAQPISREEPGDGRSVEERDPELFRMHEELARKVEDAMGGLPQEVEAAYRRDLRVVFVLQTKRMELRRGRTERFRDVCHMESNRIGRGIGVHGGALSGVATFSTDPEQVKELKERLEEPVILIRKETSTDDVALMPLVDGILTAVGGASSHAAILAQKFDLTAVVGCPDMDVGTNEEGNPYAAISTYALAEGLPISIDGTNGLVYSGVCAFLEEETTY
jgi:pyruvate,orthophosphate dikinase